MNLYAYPGGFFYLLCSFRYFVLRLSLTIKSGVAGWCSILRVLFCIWLLQLIVYVRFLLWFSWSETNMLLDGTYASEIMSINSSPFVRSNNWMPREFVVCNITRFATGSSSIKTGLTIGLLSGVFPRPNRLVHQIPCLCSSRLKIIMDCFIAVYVVPSPVHLWQPGL